MAKDDPRHLLSATTEWQSQLQATRADRPIRIVASLIVYAIATLFLPWPWVVFCAAVNYLGEAVFLALAQGLEPDKDKNRFRLSLFVLFIVDLSFATPAVLSWHAPSPYAMAFSVGMIAAALLHTTTVRAIYLPSGTTGLLALGTVLVASNIQYYLVKGGAGLLALTLLCSALAVFYGFFTMRGTNLLHRAARQDQVAAQSANAAKDRFLAQISHELRTPLNAIVGIGHAEARRVTDPLSQERLGVLISSAEGLATILDDLLELSALQSGEAVLRPKAISPRQEIKAALALFRPSIEEAGLTLYCDIDAAVPGLIVLDPQRLRQCLSNLLSNALRHTRRGWIYVHGTCASDAAGSYLVIHVADAGEGLLPEQRPHVFEPFTRGSRAAGSGTGRGLGLAISRALARQMGGDLELSPSGYIAVPKHLAAQWARGASFRLTLGYLAAPNALDSAVPVPYLQDAGSLAEKTFLIVDDIASNRLVARAYCMALGVRCLDVASGPEALVALREARIDLVLLDMMMPEMDGIAAFRAIRALAGAAGKVPVIALTADTLDSQRCAYLKQGLDGYIAKPFSPEKLAQECLRVLQLP